MKNISKIGLGLALILGLSACGAKNNESVETQKVESTTEAKNETDPLKDKDAVSYTHLTLPTKA